MRILYLGPPTAGDQGALAYTFLEEEAQALQRAGHQLYVLATHGHDRNEHGIQVRALTSGRGLRERIRTPPFLLRHRVVFRSKMNLRGWRNAYHFARIESFAASLVRKEGIALIHSHFAWPAGIGGAMAAMETGRPLIASFRGMDLNVHDGLGYGMRLDPGTRHSIEVLLRRAAHTTYVSDYLRRIGLANGANPATATTILKGVDLDRFAPAPDRRALCQRLGVRSPMLISVCGLQKLKGIHYVLEALATLQATHDFSYVLIGDGEERESLQRQAQRLGLGDRVSLLGRLGRTVVPEYFAACDALILGSLTEASGNVALETMASGRPVVCTDSGGPPEYVLDQRTGFVVPVGDVPAMATSIRRLLEEPDLADTLGQAGRRRMVEGFSYSRMIGDICSLYDRVLREAVVQSNGPHRPPAGR